MRNPRRQGDLGEFSALEWLGWKGYPVWLPFGHSPNIDLVAEIDGRLVGIQVKTSTVFRHGRFDVTLCTRGGNQSWSGLVKHFSSARCDWLFVLVADGRAGSSHPTSWRRPPAYASAGRNMPPTRSSQGAH
jgi:hypothetical protein